MLNKKGIIEKLISNGHIKLNVKNFSVEFIESLTSALKEKQSEINFDMTQDGDYLIVTLEKVELL